MKHNKFSKFIEHILVCLPLLFLGITSAYVVFNKNAKDSYSDSYVQESTTITSFDQIVEGANYLISNPNGKTGFYNGYIYFYNSINVDWYEYTGSNTSHTYVGFGIEGYQEPARIRLYYDINDLSAMDTIYAWGSNDLNEIYFNLNSFNRRYDSSYNNGNNVPYTLTLFTEKVSTLNNVLPYAMGEFNKLGFGKIPFTSFFTNIFMNGETNVYVEFVNSYLNYFLFVECTYFLPMVIYWFIHFGERLIDKFSNKEF